MRAYRVETTADRPASNCDLFLDAPGVCRVAVGLKPLRARIVHPADRVVTACVGGGLEGCPAFKVELPPRWRLNEAATRGREWGAENFDCSRMTYPSMRDGGRLV